MPTDNFARFQAQLGAPGINAVAVTPGTADLEFVTRAVYISVGGTVQTVMQGGGTVNWGSVPTGTWLNVRVTKILAAAGAVAIW